MSVVTLADLRERMRSTGVTDPGNNLQELIDAAEAEYEEYVAPLTATTHVEFATPRVYSGWYGIYLSRVPVASITSIYDSTGTTLVAATDYNLEDAANGLIRPASSSVVDYSGTFGYSPLKVTYTYGGLPANHREAILADLVAYIAMTQRGGSSVRPVFPGDVDMDDTGRGFVPAVMFPRIRKLAGHVIA